MFFCVSSRFTLLVLYTRLLIRKGRFEDMRSRSFAREACVLVRRVSFVACAPPLHSPSLPRRQVLVVVPEAALYPPDSIPSHFSWLVRQTRLPPTLKLRHGVLDDHLRWRVAVRHLARDAHSTELGLDHRLALCEFTSTLIDCTRARSRNIARSPTNAPPRRNVCCSQSRISVPADKMYSAGSAVLLNECLKGTISLSIAFYNALNAQSAGPSAGYVPISGDDKQNNVDEKRQAGRTPLVELLTLPRIKRAAAKMRNEVFRCVGQMDFRATRSINTAGGSKLAELTSNCSVRSSDCWKLSIPACLYVVQNNVSRGAPCTSPGERT